MWIEMICLMHDSPKYGYLLRPDGSQFPADQLLRTMGVSESDYLTHIDELRGASVFSETPSGIIFSRRMIKDEYNRREWRKCKRNQRDVGKDVHVVVHKHVQAMSERSSSSSSSSSSIKKKEKTTTAQAPLPEWCPLDAWNDFRLMRQKIRKPMTGRAEQLVLQKLDALRQLGQDPKAVLEQSICNSWQGIFPLKEDPVNGGNYASVGRRQAESDRSAAEALRRMG